MLRVAREIAGRYALGALCPATSPLYERLGWRFSRSAHVRCEAAGAVPYGSFALEESSPAELERRRRPE